MEIIIEAGAAYLSVHGWRRARASLESWNLSVSLRAFALRLLPGVMLGALFANQLYAREIPYQPYPLKIQVLSSEFSPADASAEFPKACDLKHYSDACATGKTPAGKSVMRIEDDWGRKYTLSCDADANWSHCSPLAEKQYYRARRHSNGITIAYPGAAGQNTPHFYLYSGKAAHAAKHKRAAQPAEAQQSAQAAVEPPGAAAAVAQAAPGEKRIRCRFTSTPDGAEIQIDGHYFGNTPSEIGLPTGTHQIVISLPGFAEWKRELTVTADSSVNVTANLQKSQH